MQCIFAIWNDGYSEKSCKFANMKQTLPDYIKNNEDLQQILQKQEGSFIKYFTEHLDDNDVNGTWYQRYQDYVFSNYRKVNSIDPDVMLLSLDEQRKKALGGNHMREEFRRRKELEKILSQMPKEAAEVVQEVQHLADGYLAFAFHQHIERCNPDHATDVGFYRSVIEQYSFPDGLFYRCMNIVLKEHHGYGLTEDDQYDAYRILEYRHFYLRRDDCYARLRRAVKEILSKRDVDPQREIDYLVKGVRNFAQHVHTDLYVEAVRSQAKGMKDPEARKETMQRADQRESDGRWLRQQAEESRLEPNTMLFCFAWFVDVLKHISHIWAARLLRYHKIDMHKIEIENDCVLNPNYRPGPDGFDPYYYVDHHYKGDTPVECCISDVEQAKELLKRLPKEETEDSKNKNSGNFATVLKDSIMELVDNINNNPEQITSIGKIIAKAKFDWSFMEAILCGLKEEWLMDMTIQIIEDKWNECANKKEDCCYQTIGHIPDYGFDGIGMYQKDLPLKMLKYINIKSALESAKADELKRRKISKKFETEIEKLKKSKSGNTRPPREHVDIKKATHSFIYKPNGLSERESNKRLITFFGDLCANSKYIDSDTDSDVFLKNFTGVHIAEKILWTAEYKQLLYLIRKLHDAGVLTWNTEKPKPRILQMICIVFQKLDNDYVEVDDKFDKEKAKHIHDIEVSNLNTSIDDKDEGLDPIIQKLIVKDKDELSGSIEEDVSDMFSELQSGN